MIIGIIPARKGSKGIPGKNLVNVAGRPLISYTIDAALKSSLDLVVVSSDCPEVRALANHLGVKCIHERNENMATDKTSMAETVTDILAWLNVDKEQKISTFLLLQPTSPLRNEHHINQVMDMVKKGKRSVVSVCEAYHHPNEIYYQGLHGFQPLITADSSLTRRQDYKTSYYYFVNGAIYASDRSLFLNTHQFIHSESDMFVMSQQTSIDIDEMADIELAEFYLRKLADD